MNKLYRFELDFNPTMQFVKDNLEEVNTLSNELLNLVDFNSGVFFTLLFLGSNLDRLYEFKEGIILPQNPIIECQIDGITSKHSRTPTIKEELSEFIFNNLNNNKKLSCIFDDVTCGLNDSSLRVFYEKKVIYLHKNEVIYVIRQNNNNLELISNCIWNSFSFWHSIGILTEANCFKNDNTVLSLESIQSICKNAKTIIISAYDGEGYVFWEKISA